MNKTLKILIISDIFVFSGFGLIGPILAIFIKDNLIEKKSPQLAVAG